jgi:hypothetical protein
MPDKQASQQSSGGSTIRTWIFPVPRSREGPVSRSFAGMIGTVWPLVVGVGGRHCASADNNHSGPPKSGR